MDLNKRKRWMELWFQHSKNNLDWHQKTRIFTGYVWINPEKTNAAVVQASRIPNDQLWFSLMIKSVTQLPNYLSAGGTRRVKPDLPHHVQSGDVGGSCLPGLLRWFEGRGRQHSVRTGRATCVVCANWHRAAETTVNIFALIFLTIKANFLL